MRRGDSLTDNCRAAAFRRIPELCLILRITLRLTAHLILLASIAPASSSAQTVADAGYYARTNSFGILGAYSWNSSHMLLGSAEKRKLINIGASYTRKLLLNRIVNWQYNAEILPVALEGDPLTRTVVDQTSPSVATLTSDGGPLITCAPITEPYSYTENGIVFAGAVSIFCHGRQWTIGEALSPIGMQWNFLPSHKLQPFLIAHGGYMYSTRAIPVEYAGSFNFTFDLGAGVELYQSRTRSVRLEYRYHHISNHDTADFNPGIDNGLLQCTYLFGR
jgi:hypothetical protein